MTKLSTLLREPLFHFLILGAGIFTLYDYFSPVDASYKEEIVMSKAKLEALSSAFLRAKGRAPSSDEIEKQLQYEIRQEILYREAMAMGLDKGDKVIRRRLAQKMKYLFEDLTVVEPPNDEILQKFVETHKEKFIIPSVLSFSQIYFDPKQHEGKEFEVAKKLLPQLKNTTNVMALGDRSLLPYDFKEARKSDVRSMFGEVFMAQAFKAEVGKWLGPLTSAYGVHLIYIHTRKEAYLPPLSEMHGRATREYIRSKEQEANEVFYQSIAQRYEVVVDEEVHKDANVSVKP